MINDEDRLEHERESGGNFMVGLLAGTVLGAGLGMLFAPKPGAELRSQLTDQASSVRERAYDVGSRIATGIGNPGDNAAGRPLAG
jgi:gas vesicle protein